MLYHWYALRLAPMILVNKIAQYTHRESRDRSGLIIYVLYIFIYDYIIFSIGRLPIDCHLSVLTIFRSEIQVTWSVGSFQCQISVRGLFIWCIPSSAPLTLGKSCSHYETDRETQVPNKVSSLWPNSLHWASQNPLISVIDFDKTETSDVQITFNFIHI